MKTTYYKKDGYIYLSEDERLKIETLETQHKAMSTWIPDPYQRHNMKVVKVEGQEYLAIPTTTLKSFKPRSL